MNQEPGIDPKEIARIIKEEWEKLPNLKKLAYKETYQNKLAEYEKIKELHQVLTQPPKKPTTPFFLFHKEMLSKYKRKYPDLSVNEITKIISQDWISFDVIKKREYNLEYLDERYIW